MVNPVHSPPQSPPLISLQSKSSVAKDYCCLVEKARKTRAQKCLKVRTRKQKMAMGDDIYLNMVEVLMEQGLIGKFVRKFIRIEALLVCCNKLGG